MTKEIKLEGEDGIAREYPLAEFNLRLGGDDGEQIVLSYVRFDNEESPKLMFIDGDGNTIDLFQSDAESIKRLLDAYLEDVRGNT